MLWSESAPCPSRPSQTLAISSLKRSRSNLKSGSLGAALICRPPNPPSRCSHTHAAVNNTHGANRRATRLDGTPLSFVRLLSGSFSLAGSAALSSVCAVSRRVEGAVAAEAAVVRLRLPLLLRLAALVAVQDHLAVVVPRPEERLPKRGGRRARLSM
eukprot:4525254-Pleurochrysis_carterae.AAC.2